MKFELIKEKKRLVIFEMEPGLDNCIVTNNGGFLELEYFLEERTKQIVKNYTDDEILEILDLKYRKLPYGRMTEARFLLSLVLNFKTGDGYEVYPVHDELLCMIAFDYKYSNVYTLRRRTA